MGAGASATADPDELRSAYAAWQAAIVDAHGSQLAPDAFLALLKRVAPGLHQKAMSAGEGGASLAAANSLQQQFVTTQAKLALRNQTPPSPDPSPPPLAKFCSWAPSKAINLRRALAAGMLSSEPLRLIDVAIGCVRLSALLDTGAEHCALSAAAATRCGLQPLVDENFGGTAGGIGTTRRHGRVHYAKIQLGAGRGAATRQPASDHLLTTSARDEEGQEAEAAKVSSSGTAGGERMPASTKVQGPTTPSPTATNTGVGTGPTRTVTATDVGAGADSGFKVDPGCGFVTDNSPSNGTTGTSAGCGTNGLSALAPTTSANQYYEVAFDVMEFPPHMAFDAIIGIDFLMRYRAKIDLVDSTLSIADATGTWQTVSLRKAAE